MLTIKGKVVVLGDYGVGKTSTIVRYVKNSFKHSMSPTIGASYFTCKILIKEVHVDLQIWDTAGQERYHSFAPMFYRNANAAVVMFDITSRPTFETMVDWVLELKQNVDSPMILCVVGNKIDLVDQREVSHEEASRYAVSVGATYYECSAMEGQRVGIVFGDIARGLLRLSRTYIDCYSNANRLDIGASNCKLEATESISDASNVKKKCC